MELNLVLKSNIQIVPSEEQAAMTCSSLGEKAISSIDHWFICILPNELNSESLYLSNMYI